DEVKAGRFRQDLYFRLNIVNLDIPPLRARRSDIALLANLFLERCTKRMGKEVQGFARETMNLLTRHEWPGNVRELENVVERGVAIDIDGILGPDDLPREIQSAGRPALDLDGDGYGGDERLPLNDFLDDCERRRIEQALRVSGGSIKSTAQELGVNEKTLYLKMRRHQLRKESFR
ncbi:MAG: sigma-54-dependent Fis family transcriptional regulator, partial [Myxococcales bacterium]|nr:sigma-54-dependent Fis family transcriptional regulator [Myxococcales bacterium]